MFDFDSWTLTAEDLTVITNAIDTARTGGQTHITVVGHTDTSGSADYNQKLSVRRANVVVEAMVDMGARRAAIQASGVGKTDLAVQTPDNTKEASNRRTVIGLHSVDKRVSPGREHFLMAGAPFRRGNETPKLGVMNRMGNFRTDGLPPRWWRCLWPPSRPRPWRKAQITPSRR